MMIMKIMDTDYICYNKTNATNTTITTTTTINRQQTEGEECRQSGRCCLVCWRYIGDQMATVAATTPLELTVLKHCELLSQIMISVWMKLSLNCEGMLNKIKCVMDSKRVHLLIVCEIKSCCSTIFHFQNRL